MTNAKIAKWIVEKCEAKRKYACDFCSKVTSFETLDFDSMCTNFAGFPKKEICIKNVAEALRQVEKERYGKNE